MKRNIRSITASYVKELTYDELKELDKELVERIGEIGREMGQKIDRISKVRRIVNDEAFDKAVAEMEANHER